MSWERTRSIPWSRVQQEVNETPEAQRERIWKEMRHERIQNEEQEQIHQGVTTTSEMNQKTFQDNRKTNMFGLKGQPFVMGDCFKQALFGTTLGSITGAAFGFMDGMRQAGESSVLKKASNSAKGKFLFQGTTRSGMMFGAFFGGFHTVSIEKIHQFFVKKFFSTFYKLIVFSILAIIISLIKVRYGIRVLADPGEYSEIAIAGATSLGIMMAKPTTRASLPYASMLVLMDGVNTYMNEV